MRDDLVDGDEVAAVADALEQEVLLPARSVSATVVDHVVTLSGVVAWGYQREAARDAVARVPGVTGTRNLIRVQPVPW